MFHFRYLILLPACNVLPTFTVLESIKMFRFKCHICQKNTILMQHNVEIGLLCNLYVDVNVCLMP